MIQEKYKNPAGEKSKAQIRREQLADLINVAVSDLKNGDCISFYSAGYSAQFKMKYEIPGIRILLAKSTNINKERLEELLKECQKPQHHMARKVILDRLIEF